MWTLLIISLGIASSRKVTSMTQSSNMRRYLVSSDRAGDRSVSDNICRSNGGYLVNLESKQTTAFLNKLEYLIKDRELSYEHRYYTSLQRVGDSIMWDPNCTIASKDFLDSWNVSLGEDNVGSCFRLWYDEGGMGFHSPWKGKWLSCSANRRYICQVEAQESCSISQYMGNIEDINILSRVSVPVVDEHECRQKCNSMMVDESECWFYMMEFSVCQIYLAQSQPVNMYLSQPVITSRKHTPPIYYKDCIDIVVQKSFQADPLYTSIDEPCQNPGNNTVVPLDNIDAIPTLKAVLSVLPNVHADTTEPVIETTYVDGILAQESTSDVFSWTKSKHSIAPDPETDDHFFFATTMIDLVPIIAPTMTDHVPIIAPTMTVHVPDIAPTRTVHELHSLNAQKVEEALFSAMTFPSLGFHEASTFDPMLDTSLAPQLSSETNTRNTNLGRRSKSDSPPNGEMPVLYFNTETDDFANDISNASQPMPIIPTEHLDDSILAGLTNSILSSSMPILPPDKPAPLRACAYFSRVENQTEEEKMEFTRQLVANLTIDTKNTSAYLRKYISAPDNRPAARNLGSFGVVMLVIVFGGLVLTDVPRFVLFVKDNLNWGPKRTAPLSIK